MKINPHSRGICDLWASHAWYVPGVKGMFILFAWLMIGNLIGSFVSLVLKKFVSEDGMNTYVFTLIEIVKYLPVMIYVFCKSQRNKLTETGYKVNSSHFGPFQGWQIAIVTAALTLAYYFSANLLNFWYYKFTMLLPGMQSFADLITEAFNDVGTGPFWSNLLNTAILAAFFEEWLYRGIVLRGLLTKMSPAWAIVISALFFAFVHMNPWQGLNGFLFGLLMGYMYYKTGSLLLTTLMHFVNNGTVTIIEQFPDLDKVDYWGEIIPLPLYAVLYILAVVVLVACLMAFRRIPLEQKRGNIDKVASRNQMES